MKPTSAVAVPSLLAAVGAMLASTGCVHEPTPVERAARVARLQCADPNESRDEGRILRETVVVTAEPITFYAGASTRTEGGQTVSGAKLVVRAPDGVSDVDMARILECHRARALLGQGDPAAPPDDPFTLPDTWVDIDVKSRGGLLVIKLSADRVWQNLDVLRRATEFADTHRQASRQ